MLMPSYGKSGYNVDSVISDIRGKGEWIDCEPPQGRRFHVMIKEEFRERMLEDLAKREKKKPARL